VAAERVQKVLAAAGYGSRRACEALIADGRVTVNGSAATLGDRADAATDVITVDGVPVDAAQKIVVYALHKPAGVVTTASDPQGRPIVVDLVPPEPRVFPIGRLDADTEGLLLLTNDGDLAQLVAHPRHGVPKTYLVEAAGSVGSRELARLRRGVVLDDGPTAPARVAKVHRSGRTTAFEVTIREGRNRQVRRMADAVGGDVRRLVRTRVGPVSLGRLAAGRWRRLSPIEVDRLRRVAAGTPLNGRPESQRPPPRPIPPEL